MKHLSSKACLALSVICLIATVVTAFAFSAIGGSNFMLGSLVLLLGGIYVWGAAQYLNNLEHPHPAAK